MKVKNSWAGFTLVESIIALSVISFIILMLNMLMKVENKTVLSFQRKSELNWHIFLSQLEYGSKKWEFKELDKSRLYFVEKKESGKETQVIIEKYANQLKERKNGGYNPLLIGVETCYFKKSDYGVIINVTMEDGKVFESVFPQWH